MPLHARVEHLEAIVAAGVLRDRLGRLAGGRHAGHGGTPSWGRDRSRLAAFNAPALRIEGSRDRTALGTPERTVCNGVYASKGHALNRAGPSQGHPPRHSPRESSSPGPRQPSVTWRRKKNPIRANARRGLRSRFRCRPAMSRLDACNDSRSSSGCQSADHSRKDRGPRFHQEQSASLHKPRYNCS